MEKKDLVLDVQSVSEGLKANSPLFNIDIGTIRDVVWRDTEGFTNYVSPRVRQGATVNSGWLSARGKIEMSNAKGDHKSREEGVKNRAVLPNSKYSSKPEHARSDLIKKMVKSNEQESLNQGKPKLQPPYQRFRTDLLSMKGNISTSDLNEEIRYMEQRAASLIEKQSKIEEEREKVIQKISFSTDAWFSMKENSSREKIAVAEVKKWITTIESLYQERENLTVFLRESLLEMEMLKKYRGILIEIASQIDNVSVSKEETDSEFLIDANKIAKHILRLTAQLEDECLRINSTIDMIEELNNGMKEERTMNNLFFLEADQLQQLKASTDKLLENSSGMMGKMTSILLSAESDEDIARALPSSNDHEQVTIWHQMRYHREKALWINETQSLNQKLAECHGEMQIMKTNLRRQSESADRLAEESLQHQKDVIRLHGVIRSLEDKLVKLKASDSDPSSNHTQYIDFDRIVEQSTKVIWMLEENFSSSIQSRTSQSSNSPYALLYESLDQLLRLINSFQGKKKKPTSFNNAQLSKNADSFRSPGNAEAKISNFSRGSPNAHEDFEGQDPYQRFQSWKEAVDHQVLNEFGPQKMEPKNSKTGNVHMTSKPLLATSPTLSTTSTNQSLEENSTFRFSNTQSSIRLHIQKARNIPILDSSTSGGVFCCVSLVQFSKSEKDAIDKLSHKSMYAAIFMDARMRLDDRKQLEIAPQHVSKLTDLTSDPLWDEEILITHAYCFSKSREMSIVKLADLIRDSDQVFYAFLTIHQYNNEETIIGKCYVKLDKDLTEDFVIDIKMPSGAPLFGLTGKPTSLSGRIVQTLDVESPIAVRDASASGEKFRARQAMSWLGGNSTINSSSIQDSMSNAWNTPMTQEMKGAMC
eukprot:764280-Hanusia_phi.AAC.3